MILNHRKIKVLLRICLYALILLLPFYLLVRASVVWNADPVFYNDDVWFARMCWPSGLTVFWQEYGFYRILKIPFFVFLNRFVLNSTLPHPLLSLAVIAFATLVFIKASVAAGLPLNRGVVLGALLGGCPLLAETSGFWTGALNYSLTLLLLALHLRATAWAQNFTNFFRVVSIAAVSCLALLTYEVVIPFVLATSVLYVKERHRQLVTVALAFGLLAAIVLLLAALDFYNPFRFTEVDRRLSSGASTILSTSLAAWQQRAVVYGTLLPSFLRTGLACWAVWALIGSLVGVAVLVWRNSEENSEEGALPRNLIAACFAFSFLAVLGYLVMINSFTGRYMGLLAIFGFSAVAWAKGKLATFTLSVVLVVQGIVTASLPVHLRDADMVHSKQSSYTSTNQPDVIAVNGRLTRRSWGSRYARAVTGGAASVAQWRQLPLGVRCRYVSPCEECR